MVVWQTGYYNISIKTKSKQDRVIDRFIFSYCLSSPECLNNTILHFVNSVVSKSDINKKKMDKEFRLSYYSGQCDIEKFLNYAALMSSCVENNHMTT